LAVPGMRASSDAAISQVAESVWKLPAVSQSNAAVEDDHDRGGDDQPRGQRASHRDLRILHLHTLVHENPAAHFGVEFVLIVLLRRGKFEQQLRRRELGWRRREPGILTPALLGCIDVNNFAL
jgi:hypothetical protein